MDQGTNMAHDVFISHSHHDKIAADLVCACLEARKIRCWIAPRDILPGMTWGKAIVDAIGESGLMVLIFSTQSNKSVQVLREVERAVNKGIAILPVRLEDVAPSGDLEYFLSITNWLDAITAPIERHLDQVAETARMILQRARERRGGNQADVLPSLAPEANLPATASPEPEIPALIQAMVPAITQVSAWSIANTVFPLPSGPAVHFGSATLQKVKAISVQSISEANSTESVHELRDRTRLGIATMRVLRTLPGTPEIGPGHSRTAAGLPGFGAATLIRKGEYRNV